MRDLCDSAKKGKRCGDSLCQSDPTLCGFDKDDYDFMDGKFDEYMELFPFGVESE